MLRLPCKLLVSLVQPVLQDTNAFKAGTQLILEGTQVCNCHPYCLV